MARVESIHPSVQVHPTARINVTERLVIGEGGVIGEGCEISGRDIEIGQELWMDRGARIGGGSCFEARSQFRAGHFLHMGQDAFINTARAVSVGDEVGLGTRTALYTHGAYLSALEGFPVAFAPIWIGNNVWLPGATVNPGAIIGDNVVVAVGGVVTTDLPSGCLAAGVPARVIRENAYPAPLTGEAHEAFWMRLASDGGFALRLVSGDVLLDGARFMPAARMIWGPVTDETERLRNEMRRYGIRFHARPRDGEYQPWEDR